MWELPTSTPEDVKKTWQMVNRTNLEHNEKVELFFKLALQGFYSPMMDGMKSDAGHIIYRLSDYLTPEERQGIVVYHSNPETSLDDWRTEWEKLHGSIPIITVKLLTS